MLTAEEKESDTELAQAPVFVVGMWRSGTSLFYALLNQHPQIALLYEGDLPLLWPLFLGGKAKADWPERWEFWNSGASRHHVDLQRLPRNVATVREASQAVWGQYSSGTIPGCKSPNYFDMLPSLARQFPDARFIVIWRDPTDVCRSVERASKGDSFFAKRGMFLRALRGCHEMKLGYDALVAQGNPVHTVQYETLASSPAEVMEGICRFLKVEFHPRMASLQDADRSAIYEGEHHEKVKSERIAASKPAGESLPPEVRRKIERYVSYWHSRYETWPAVPERSNSKPGAWFALEHFMDGILYRALRILDWAIVFVYCFAPLSMLRKYRALRGRKSETVAVRKEILVQTRERMNPVPDRAVALDRTHGAAHSGGRLTR